MAFIPGGTFKMGSERHQPEERFTHAVRVDDFWIDRHEVTNAQFKQFVDATGYVTLAERGLDPKAHPNMASDCSLPGSVVFIQPTDSRRRPDHAVVAIRGGRELAAPTAPAARSPEGEPSGRARRLRGRACLCALARSRPADGGAMGVCRARRARRRGRWRRLRADGKPIANTWQGLFPVLNTEKTAMSAPHRLAASSQRLRARRHDRQRLGVDERLVPPGICPRSSCQSAGPELISSPFAAGASGEPGHQGRLPPLRAQLFARYRPAARQPRRPT